MSKIFLVTGVTGLIGQKVLISLCKMNVSVRVIVRRGNAYKIPKSAAIESILESDDLFTEGAEWWSNACKDVDTVIHLAWFVKPGKYLHSYENIACLSGTINFGIGAVTAGIKRFLGVGTCFEYEISDQILTTDTQLKPHTLYGASKVSAYMTLSQIFKSAKISFAWARLFYMYDLDEDPQRLVGHIREKLKNHEIVVIGGGHLIRDYLSVDEVAAGILKAAFSSIQGGLNICSGNQITIEDFAHSIAKKLNLDPLFNFDSSTMRAGEPDKIVGLPSFASDS